MNSTPENTIGCIIKKNRLKLFPNRGGLAECARRFGVHHQQWRDWESGKRVPSVENQIKLAAFLGITLSELRGESGGPDVGAPPADIESRLSSLEEKVSELMHDKFLASFPKQCRHADQAWELLEPLEDAAPGFYCKYCLAENGKLVLLPVKREDIMVSRAGYKEVRCPGCGRDLSIQ